MDPINKSVRYKLGKISKREERQISLGLVLSDMVKHKLQVTSYELRVRS